MVLAQGDNQFIKRRVLLPQNVGADPRLHVGQLAPAWIALTLRRQTACLALQLQHVVDEPHRHAEVRRRAPVRMTFLDEVDYAPAKLDWMRPSHRKPPLVVIPKKGNHKNPSRGNPLNQITSNPLSHLSSHRQALADEGTTFWQGASPPRARVCSRDRLGG